MTRVAESDKVIKTVVPSCLDFSKSLPVNMMDMEVFCTSTMLTGEAISLKGVEIVNVSVLADELSQKRAFLGAIKLVQRRPWVLGIADNTSEDAAAGFAMFLVIALNWMKLVAAFSTRLCIELRLPFFVLSLARLASDLQRVIGIKHRTTCTRSHFDGFFHQPIIGSLGVLNHG